MIKIVALPGIGQVDSGWWARLTRVQPIEARAGCRRPPGIETGPRREGQAQHAVRVHIAICFSNPLSRS